MRLIGGRLNTLGKKLYIQDSVKNRIDLNHSLVCLKKDKSDYLVIGNLTHGVINKPDIKSHILNPIVDYQYKARVQNIVLTKHCLTIKQPYFREDIVITKYINNNKIQLLKLIQEKASQNLISGIEEFTSID